MNENVHAVIQKFAPYASEFCTVHIGHQITNNSFLLKEIPKHITYHPSKTIWLSLNRNILLNSLNSWIYVVVDDDVDFVDWFDLTLRNAFNQYKNHAFITFQSITHKGVLRKEYSSFSYDHTLLTILKVSSIEIAFDIKQVKDLGVVFDESFGLGSKIRSWEENILLSDLLKKWGKGKYIPIPLTVHPVQSSWKIIKWNEKLSIFKRIFWIAGYWVIMAFFFKIYFLNKRKILIAYVTNR